MIIWLISEINNNNCLSLLIRALSSKRHSSAEFQGAGFTAKDSVLSWKKETWLYLGGAHGPTPKPRRAGKLRAAPGSAREMVWDTEGIFLASVHAEGRCPRIQGVRAKSYKHRPLGPEHRRKDSCFLGAHLTSSIHALQVQSGPYATLFTQASC